MIQLSINEYAAMIRRAVSRAIDPDDSEAIESFMRREYGHRFQPGEEMDIQFQGCTLHLGKRSQVKSLTPKEILDLPMDANDGKAATVRDYLRELLRRLWVDGEGFSGKRPFGNSGWECDLYLALVKSEAIRGTIDEEGCLDILSTEEERRGRRLISEAITSL